ncbi:hypothetical protein ACIHIX_34605 [Streptomyces sp. NPDC051913]|uniref:hypothetical protein n=1 Tax=Streptomyces sp. NPDC051913 TaxID=3365676 RepID=UPI0037CEC618
MELHSELPDGFSDLAPFLDRWRLTGQQSRMRAMAAADMPELRTFYDALLPRIDAIVAHLNQFPVDDLPPPGAGAVRPRPDLRRGRPPGGPGLAVV